MAELTPEIVSQIVDACTSAAEDIADALGRALDGKFSVSVGQSTPYSAQELPVGLEGPGLAIVLILGDVGLVAAMPDTSGLLPEWCVKPDATGESKLNALAQELGLLLVPNSFRVESFRTAHVENLASSLIDAKFATDAVLVPLALTAGDKQGTLSILWPCAAPNAIFLGATASDESISSNSADRPIGRSASSFIDFSHLPSYARGLLKVEIPVTVNLAEKRQSVGEIVELTPGSIITFEKSCDELLELCIGNRPIADGEAVKVDDKFGLRIHEMRMPQERFAPLRKSASS